MTTHQEDGREIQHYVSSRQGEPSERHDTHFRDLHIDHHALLAVTVRQPATQHREEDERRREDGRHQGDHPILRASPSGSGGTGHEDQDDQLLERIVAERVLELRPHQAPEATLPAGCRENRGWGHPPSQAQRSAFTNLLEARAA